MHRGDRPGEVIPLFPDESEEQHVERIIRVQHYARHLAPADLRDVEERILQLLGPGSPRFRR